MLDIRIYFVMGILIVGLMVGLKAKIAVDGWVERINKVMEEVRR